MSRRVRDWCDICRDTDPDIRCTNEGCGRKFHESCLRTINLWDSSTKRDSFVCADCTAANVNDGTCYVCKQELYAPPPPTDAEEEEEEEEEEEKRSKRGRLLTPVTGKKAPTNDPAAATNRQVTRAEAETIEGILLCDGCSNSAHKACLGVQENQARDDDELWFCTECDPHGETAKQLTEAKERASKRLESGSPGQTRTKLGGNVDICYVCQKSGKLLGCDFCEQSYHPRCIDSDFLEFEVVAPEDPTVAETEKWRCPLCKGEDPLKSMSTRRLSRTAMLRMQREMQKCIQQQHRISKTNRDRFLWSSRHTMRPFMMEKAMARLTKLFGKKRRSRKGRFAEEDSDETEEESDDAEAETKMTSMERLEKNSVEAYRVALKAARKAPASLTLDGGLLKPGVQLKPYQIVGVGWLLHSFFHKAGAILADEMGLGKTVQCLTFISALKAMGITGPHLIVVPLSTVGNWAREIRRFVPHLKFVKICGSRFERDHIMADVVAAQGLHDLYITTYETVVTEESFFCDNFDWQCIILDEAHRIKNETGRIRHSLDRVCANMRVLLTGTPLQNNIKELFTLLNFMFPEILEHSDDFERAFLKSDASATEQSVDQHIMDALFQLLSKMMLRRTKDLVVRLPKKIEHDLWLPLSPTSAYWYKQLLDVSEAAFESQSVRKLLGTVIKMRICTCHPKGLVSRDAQLNKFKELFQTHNDPCKLEELEKQAEKLQHLEGEEHVLASSKLIVLDRLLMQLHLQNIKESSAYRKAYEQNLRDLYVQSHPLPPIPIPKAKPKRRIKKDVNGATPDVKSETDAAAPTEDGATPEPTARQAAEKARRERQALISLQQKELDEKCERSVAETLEKHLRMCDNSLDWLLDAMLPGQVSDAPIPMVKALLEEELEKDEEDEEVDEDMPTESFNMGDDEDAEDASNQLVTPKQNREHPDDDSADTEDEAAEKSQDGLDDETARVEISPDMQPHNDSKGSPLMEYNTELPTAVTPKVDMNRTPALPPQKEEVEAPQNVAPRRMPHKVLVFTQFQLVLDELEAYCRYRGFKYLRLDGSTNKMIRELDIREFNSPDSSHLVYLICTRAGGVGINLITANHVLLYDEDWNPFMDLQAIDRAHRIGQKREVHVWKLVTEWTVEERMAFRRLQKLQLDKLFIQANNAGNVGTSSSASQEGENEEDHTEKFSVDEIRRLIRYGREAIKSLVQPLTETASGGELAGMSLTSIMGRPRQALPEFVEDSSVDDPSLNVLVSDNEEEVVLPVDDDGLPEGSENPTAAQSRMSTSADEADVPVSMPQMSDSQTANEDRTAPVTEEENFEEAKRSRRLRRRVTTVYGNPQAGEGANGAASKSQVMKERKILHDKRCFRCGCGNNAMDENADPLIACHRCPRVYHMKGCLGFDAPPRKTWVCQWHECSLCFRKGSQAGGLLIHCGECPTTFCFDCFPPEYKRWHPPATYFSELNRRGYHVNADKLVLFLCSRCKALKEQQRRRMLTRQQMDVEMRKRREAQEKARKDTQQRIKDTIKETMKEDQNPAAAIALATALAKRGGDIKKNFLARKKVKDEQDKESLNNIRAAYQRLFPEEFIAVLKEKRANQIAAKSEAVGPDGMDSEMRASSGKMLVSKLPSEYCKVCDNCHLPGHEVSACPFPLEAVKKPEGGAVEEAEESPKGGKRVMRSYCPKCGVSSRNHCRRHCDLLTDEDKEEYDQRREKILQFVECLNNAPPAKLPPNTVCNIQNVESTRRFLQKTVDQVVKDCLRQAGLEKCVNTSQVKLGRRKKRRVSEESGAEESALEDDEEDMRDVSYDGPNIIPLQPTISPRKRARNDDINSDGNIDDASQPIGEEALAKSRPRRKTKPSTPEEKPKPAPTSTVTKKKAKPAAPVAPVAVSTAPPRAATPPINAFLPPRPVQSYLPPGSAAARQQTLPSAPYWQYQPYTQPTGWPAYPPPQAFAFGMPPGNITPIPNGLPPRPPSAAYGQWQVPTVPPYQPVRQVGLNQNGLPPQHQPYQNPPQK